MANYRYEIQLSGYAHEIVIGSISEESVSKVLNILDENNISLSELYKNLDILDENSLLEWRDNDDKEHIYGTSTEDLTITIIDLDSSDTVLKKDFYDLFNYEESIYEKDLIEYEYEDEELFHASTTEKGIPMEAVLELDEPFDESKLKFEIVEISVGDYDFEVIRKLHYNGKEISTDVNSTEYKDFNVSIIVY